MDERTRRALIEDAKREMRADLIRGLEAIRIAGEGPYWPGMLQRFLRGLDGGGDGAAETRSDPAQD